MKALITTVSMGEKDGTTKEYHHDISFDELNDRDWRYDQGRVPSKGKGLCL